MTYNAHMRSPSSIASAGGPSMYDLCRINEPKSARLSVGYFGGCHILEEIWCSPALIPSLRNQLAPPRFVRAVCQSPDPRIRCLSQFSPLECSMGRPT